MVVLTLRGRPWMRSFRLKTIQNIEFFVFHVLREFCSFYAPRTLSPCCSHPFDEATYYGVSHTPTKGIDAFVSFKNLTKHGVPCFSHFGQVLLVSRSEDIVILFFTSV